MRSAASRLHKGFSFAKRFRECSDWICCDGAAWAGRWAQWAPGGAVRDQPFSRVVLDLGCGKGEYTVACAKMCPDVLFIGFDVDAVSLEGSSAPVNCPELAHASRASVGKGARSGAPAEIDLSTVFVPAELSALLMNFPTPFPKKKKSHLRLTYLDRLMGYRSLLAQGAGIRLRTDSQPLRDFTLTQLELAGYEVTWRSDDVRSEFPDEPWSAYERKLTEQGACAFGIAACPGPAPEHVEQTAPLSLVSYLPDNLDQLEYVPHGMQGCVENLRNRNARERARGKKEFRPPVI